ncbi:hypothetical protein SNE40_011047 [Patella caerulea]|uniref:Uncharacterized protein n=1 Tax=Patella caerulea TaxID=87958 RepID=A0AAN8PVI7_PATCE
MTIKAGSSTQCSTQRKRQTTLSELMDIQVSNKQKTVSLSDKEHNELRKSISQNARILTETGKNSTYNKNVNDECVRLAMKCPSLLLGSGGKGELLKRARDGVSRYYKFKKGFSQGRISDSRKQETGEISRKRWSKELREEAMRTCEENLSGINQDIQIYSRQLEIKMKCEKFEEAEIFRRKITDCQNRRSGVKSELKMLRQRELRSDRDARSNRRKIFGGASPSSSDSLASPPAKRQLIVNLDIESDSDFPEMLPYEPNDDQVIVQEKEDVPETSDPPATQQLSRDVPSDPSVANDSLREGLVVDTFDLETDGASTAAPNDSHKADDSK